MDQYTIFQCWPYGTNKQYSSNKSNTQIKIYKLYYLKYIYTSTYITSLNVSVIYINFYYFCLFSLLGRQVVDVER